MAAITAPVTHLGAALDRVNVFVIKSPMEYETFAERTLGTERKRDYRVAIDSEDRIPAREER
jgi:hypothetical protein